ncbi:MAG: hydroxymethylbilane synthase [Chloroflexota bacterium]
MAMVARGVVRVGTRGSTLALVQAALAAAALREAGATVQVETIATDGDRRTPDTTWGEGAFVTAIEQALRDGRVDVAVHSAKDLPVDQDPGLAIAAYLPRAQVDDVLVMPAGHSASALVDLPAGTRVGTDSPRRTAFLRAARPDLVVHPLHGNVDTRLRRLDAGETDALVLAAAGLRRLGREDRISVVLPFETIPPAPGQGALAMQVRADDGGLRRMVATLDDGSTRRAVEAERAVLAAAGGGCRASLGALGTIVDGRLRLRVGYATTDGQVAALASADGDATSTVVRVALERLAKRAMESAAAVADSDRPRVVVARVPERSAALTLALIDRGFSPLVVPTIDIETVHGSALDGLIQRLTAATWVVVTSVAAVEALITAAARDGFALAAAASRWAAVGATTAQALRSAGVAVSFRPDRETAVDLGDTLPLLPGQTVLLVRGDLADDDFPRRLTERGAVVHSAVVYRTTEAPAGSRDLLRAALTARPRAVVMTSPSTVRGWLQLARDIGAEAEARAIDVVAIGPTSAAAAREHDLRVVAQAATPRPADIAEAVRSSFHAPEETK